jgi:hypothetical protein
MSWNDALSAWDEKIDVMREVHEAYVGHLGDLLKGLSGGELTDHGFGRMERVHSLAVGNHPQAVEVRAWPTRPWGGEAGKVAVSVSLSADLVEDESFPSDVAGLCKALKVKRGPVESGRVLVKRGTILLDGSGTKERVNRAWTSAFEQAPTLAKRLKGLSRGSPYQWLRSLMLELVKSGVFEESGPEGTRTSGRLGDWAGGRQFTVYGDGMPQLFLTAVPDGRMMMHFGYKRRTTPEEASRVCETVGLRPMEIEGYAGGVLLLKNETLAAFQEDEALEIKRRVLAGWRAYQSCF